MAAGVAEGSAPEGFLYVPDVLSEGQERALVADLEALDYAAVVMHGREARRRVRHFGVDYDYQRFTTAPAEPLPPSLRWVRSLAADVGGVEEERLVEVLVTQYPPGATIGWHRDAPAFGSRVVGVSLVSPCRMRFQRGKGSDREVAAVTLEPRSAYVMSGPARWSWQHSIPPVRATRYSLTFRTLRAVAGLPGTPTDAGP